MYIVRFYKSLFTYIRLFFDVSFQICDVSFHVCRSLFKKDTDGVPRLGRASHAALRPTAVLHTRRPRSTSAPASICVFIYIYVYVYMDICMYVYIYSTHLYNKYICVYIDICNAYIEHA